MPHDKRFQRDHARIWTGLIAGFSSLVLIVVLSISAIQHHLISPPIGFVDMGTIVIQATIGNNICSQRILTRPCSEAFYRVQLGWRQTTTIQYYEILHLSLDDSFIMNPSMGNESAPVRQNRA